ncbi:MAG: helix-turn-helix protein [Paenibacillus sp.]|jgi:AraC family L-rhamnose operon regulatory protein RhaS|nr:helix-turn-helix protein [Paenibacillus sp.]
MDTKRLEHYPVAADFPFWIQNNLHEPDNSPALHSHDFVEMIFVSEGLGTHNYQDMAYEVRAGDIFIINPGEVHGYSVSSGQRLEIINCLFQPGLIQRALLQELDILHGMDFFYVQPFLQDDMRFHHRLNLRGESADKTMRIMGDMLDEMKEQHPGYRALIQVKMVELMIQLSRSYEAWGDKEPLIPRSELLVKRICGYLERHFEQKITLSSISELFHIGTRQLNRQFKRYTGSSIIEYVHHLRIERAKRYLIGTDDTIATIAASIGYEDAGFFSKLFTRVIGCPPGKYREMLGEGEPS